MASFRRSFPLLPAVVALLLGLVAPASGAQKKYGPGVTDTEIKIGSTNPYSGPASAYGTIGRAETAYFNMINEQGGVNGRKINFISSRRRLQPAAYGRAGAQAGGTGRCLFLAGTLGTPPNSAIHKYVNAKGVPHIFVNTGATKWGDPKNYPLDHGVQPQLPGRRRASTRATFWRQARRQDCDPLSERRLR